MNCARPGAGFQDVETYISHVLKVFGPSRVMWASDWPPLDLASDYGSWKGVCDFALRALPDSQCFEVLEGTAVRVYRTRRIDGLLTLSQNQDAVPARRRARRFFCAVSFLLRCPACFLRRELGVNTYWALEIVSPQTNRLALTLLGRTCPLLQSLPQALPGRPTLSAVDPSDEALQPPPPGARGLFQPGAFGYRVAGVCCGRQAVWTIDRLVQPSRRPAFLRCSDAARCSPAPRRAPRHGS